MKIKHKTKTSKKSCLIIIILTFHAIVYGNDNNKSFLKPGEILEAWESNYFNLQTMEVSYTNKLDYHKQSKSNLSKKYVDIQNVERIEDGKKYYIRYSISEDGFDNPKNVMMHAFDGEKTTEYWGKRNYETIDVGLKNRDVETLNVLPEYLLCEKVKTLVYAKEFPEGMPYLSAILRPAISKSTSTVSDNIEIIGGTQCHLLVIEDSFNEISYKYKIWFAHNNGMLPMKFQYYDNNNVLRRELEVEEIDANKTEIGDFWYPKKAHKISYLKDGEEIKTVLSVNKFVPNIKVDKEILRVNFPENALIIDNILGVSYVKGAGENIEDVSSVKESNLKENEPVSKKIKPEISTDGITENHGSQNESLVKNQKINTDNSHKEEDLGSGKIKGKISIVSLSVLFILVILFAIFIYKTQKKRSIRNVEA